MGEMKALVLRVTVECQMCSEYCVTEISLDLPIHIHMSMATLVQKKVHSDKTYRR